ncbi:MAG TPA: polynucleotide adenylyltransferase PcnB, partial [Kofleriaceae bacterium]|nr:polynucleotide adenylyltransferase PcnB [Kofleriaceae bacterium]
MNLARDLIDPDADKVVRRLARRGYKAYLVGGCVRDLLLRRQPKDFDVATSATPNEIKL